MKAFDLSFQRSTDERQIREPRSLRFIHEAEAAIQAGCGAYSMTAHDLVIVLGRAVPKSMVDMRDRGHVKDRNLQVPVNILSGNFLAGKMGTFEPVLKLSRSLVVKSMLAFVSLHRITIGSAHYIGN